jgi:hypothetical protein
MSFVKKLKNALGWTSPVLDTYEGIKGGERYKVGPLVSGEYGPLSNKVITIIKTRKCTVFFTLEGDPMVQHIAKSEQYHIQKV